MLSRRPRRSFPHFHPNPLRRCYITLLTWRVTRLFASRLQLNKDEVKAVIHSVKGDVGRLEALTLQHLEETGISEETAQKLFYFVQWDKLQRHLEMYDALPESADLELLLSTLALIRERHFQRLYISASLVAMYRTIYKAHLLRGNEHREEGAP